MNDSSDIVLAYWNEHRQQLRQSEAQRAVLTNYVLAIIAGLSGFIAQQKFSSATLPMAALVIGAGLYGTIASAKYHERARYHLMQARAMTKVLKATGALPDNTHVQEFREAHYRVYPRLSRIRLHWLWTGLHLVVMVYGATLGIIIVAV